MCSLRRKLSEANVYHLVVRGVGRQIIFEDNDDRRFFICSLAKKLGEQEGKILAWCLMDNHAHILVSAKLDVISATMKYVESVYASYFNKKYDRVGTLFQGRFSSVPVESDEQLLATVRYIHYNPVKSGGSLSDKWSSYGEYVAGFGFADSTLVVDLLGGIEAFVRFHERADRDEIRVKRRLTEGESLAVARNVLGATNIHSIRALPIEARNTCLRKLKDAGLSIRQIERLTSIGRGIISRV